MAQRTKGTGSVTAIYDGAGRVKGYRARFSYVDASGVRRQPEKVTARKRDAQSWIDEQKRRRADGGNPHAERVTFAAVASEWLEQRARAEAVREEQQERNAAQVRTLNGLIGGTRICDITPASVEKLQAALMDGANNPKGGKRSKATVYKYMNTFNQVMKKAVREGRIPRNPYDIADRPRSKDIAAEDRRALALPDAQRLNDTLRDEIRRAYRAYGEKEGRAGQRRDTRGAVRGLTDISQLIAVSLALNTGARCGEILAATWSDVRTDASGNTWLTINKSLDNRGRINPPKSRESNREICLDLETVGTLREWVTFAARHFEELGAIDAGGYGELPIVCSNAGARLSKANFERWWRKWRAAHGFDTLKFHELRHTHATLLMGANVNVKEIQTRLGHSDPAITLRFYAHSDIEKAIETAGVTRQLLNPKN